MRLAAPRDRDRPRAAVPVHLTTLVRRRIVGALRSCSQRLGMVDQPLGGVSSRWFRLAAGRVLARDPDLVF